MAPKRRAQGITDEAVQDSCQNRRSGGLHAQPLQAAAQQSAQDARARRGGALEGRNAGGDKAHNGRRLAGRHVVDDL